MIRLGWHVHDGDNGACCVPPTSLTHFTRSRDRYSRNICVNQMQTHLWQMSSPYACGSFEQRLVSSAFYPLALELVHCVLPSDHTLQPPTEKQSPASCRSSWQVLYGDRSAVMSRASLKFVPSSTEPKNLRRVASLS